MQMAKIQASRWNLTARPNLQLGSLRNARIRMFEAKSEEWKRLCSCSFLVLSLFCHDPLPCHTCILSIHTKLYHTSMTTQNVPGTVSGMRTEQSRTQPQCLLSVQWSLLQCPTRCIISQELQVNGTRRENRDIVICYSCIFLATTKLWQMSLSISFPHWNLAVFMS
jgi:hypothetical protein